MPAFDLPEFYTPFPVRVNPHLDGARRDSKAWARQMGMLDLEPRIWDEQRFDAADYALNIAMRFPDASPPELGLVTAWNVWGFYLGDYILEMHTRRRDLAGAQEYVRRLKTFKPIHGLPMAVPANTPERGLADLWPRTVHVMSMPWRGRFSQHIDDMLDGHLRELANIGRDLVPDPIDYGDVRRLGMGHVVDLFEHALGAELRPDVRATLPIRTIQRTFCDALTLANDILSYERETEEEGETNNNVLAVRQALGCDVRQAVGIVNGLRTSRVQRFEHSVATELPALFDELDLDAKTRDDLRRYADGIKDAIAGALEFQLRSGRYARLEPAARPRPPGPLSLGGPTGLGTEGLRLTARAT